MSAARKDPTTPLARRLRARADALGLSNADLARQLKQHPGNVSRWFTGRVTPSVASLRMIAAALETTVDTLLHGVAVPAPGVR